MSQNDKQALRIMEKSAVLKDGHYEIALPWKFYPPNLKTNKIQAERRLQSLKRRLDNDPIVFEKYRMFMNDLVRKGYADKVEVNGSVPEGWYLPHHPVFHPQKPDKVRVVFDCSARYGGTSLNDQLLQGPDLTNTLVGVLTRFRREQIAFMADIESMYYQVRVRKNDSDYLKYLWWPDGNTEKQPEEYKMMVHLFGGVSSPSCANYALKRNAEDNRDDFDAETIKTAKESFYVDDCLHSVKTEPEAKQLIKQLQELLNQGGFRLTKWTSNSINVIESVPDAERAKSVKDLDLNFGGMMLTERALGVKWSLSTDTFGYSINKKERPATRRGMLSITSSVYDPLGFVGPCILPAKAIQQELCQKGLGWDDKIPDACKARWEDWLQDLPKLEQFSIPRCFKPLNFENIVKRELHHFSDASSHGYGAVSYLRQINVNGDISCAIVMAKSRLAPLKTMTIPRMELSAAVVSTRLDKMIKQELQTPIDSCTFWTDSTCVLRYLENKETRFQTFVANRVTTILDQSDASQWRFVDGLHNPADEASRGMTVNELLINQHWKEGPEFLKQPERTWPQRPANMGEIPQDDPEVKAKSTVCATGINVIDSISSVINYYSSWEKLKKSFAWILRYKEKLREVVRRRKAGDDVSFNRNDTVDPINVLEMKGAEIAITKHVQKCFEDEQVCLKHVSLSQPCNTKKQRALPKSSKIYKLDPILSEGVIRVGGRLQNSPINGDMKHQIILPKNHHIVKLITTYYHHLSGHSGLKYTLSLVRQKFWPIDARTAVKKVLNECFSCKRRQSSVGKQKMASLPQDRVTPSKPPFTYVGVDCFGPFEVKRGRSNVKRYGVLFTCLTVRAIHIEVSNSLDTESFMNAMRRFIARRGQPEEIRSDNGGNFKKGEKELNKAIKEWNHGQIHEFLLQRNVKWLFNPPMGSHHGGVWERCIRTVRKVMMAVLKQQALDDEGLNTLMCEAEAIVNGRPITKISDDPRDMTPLTPNHLLLLRGGNSLPPGNFSKEDMYRRRWKQVQYLSNVFWRRWVREYLPSLQQRQKWNVQKRNFAVDDVVLVLDENTPRSSWPLGRVLEVYSNQKDGLVRSVKVKTNTSTLVRPIDKLVLLENATN
ncbi:uncharacterized protein [Antedon mediterranea]|uniref:uncharacterized protein n=1 Tax=Antedon mediterranea TaxID=105859 RepID=UPI003AF91A5D